jgi:hypothetical protein
VALTLAVLFVAPVVRGDEAEALDRALGRAAAALHPENDGRNWPGRRRPGRASPDRLCLQRG